jgi:uncharacterized protein
MRHRRLQYKQNRFSCPVAAIPLVPWCLGVIFWDVIQDTTSDWILTFSGLRVWPLDPRPQDIRIEDIAHALAHQSRFGGHCRIFYSIAQHSVLVSKLCRPEDAPWGLLHDASEAYLGDAVRPLKELAEFAAYRRAEQRLQRCIAERFGLGPDQPASVTAVDDLMLAVEYRDLMTHPMDEQYIASPPPDCAVSIQETWSPVMAELHFLARFNHLFAA